MSLVVRTLATGFLLLGVSGLNTDSVDNVMQMGSDASHRIMRKEGKEGSASSSAAKEKTAPQDPDVDNDSFEFATFENSEQGIEQYTNVLPGSPDPMTLTSKVDIGTWTFGGPAGKVELAPIAVDFASNGVNYEKLHPMADTGGVMVSLMARGSYIKQDVGGHIPSTGSGCDSMSQTSRNPDCTYYKLSFYASTIPLSATTSTTTAPPRIDIAFQQNGTLELHLHNGLPVEMNRQNARCNSDGSDDPDYCERLIEKFIAYQFVYYTTDATVGVNVTNDSPNRLWRTELPYPAIGVDRFQIKACHSAYYPTSACPDKPESQFFGNVGRVKQCGADAAEGAAHAHWRDC